MIRIGFVEQVKPEDAGHEDGVCNVSLKLSYDLGNWHRA
jgi:hypothetical protein